MKKLFLITMLCALSTITLSQAFVGFSVGVQVPMVKKVRIVRPKHQLIHVQNVQQHHCCCCHPSKIAVIQPVRFIQPRFYPTISCRPHLGFSFGAGFRL